MIEFILISRYNHLQEDIIRDRIVVSLQDAALSDKLQVDAEFTLDKAVWVARETEVVKKQQTLFREGFQEAKPEREVDYVIKSKVRSTSIMDPKKT